LEIRKRDLSEIADLIKKIGSLLEYKTEIYGNYPDTITLDSQFKEPVVLIWIDNACQKQYLFYIITTAIFGMITLPPILGIHKTVSEMAQIPNKVILIPGGRAGLVGYKFDHDIRFGDSHKMDWIFLKFRHLRRLADDRLITRTKFTQNITLDPLANTDPQMTFL
jgi:hypothetical protein